MIHKILTFVAHYKRGLYDKQQQSYKGMIKEADKYKQCIHVRGFVFKGCSGEKKKGI